MKLTDYLIDVIHHITDYNAVHDKNGKLHFVHHETTVNDNEIVITANIDFPLIEFVITEITEQYANENNIFDGEYLITMYRNEQMVLQLNDAFIKTINAVQNEWYTTIINYEL